MASETKSLPAMIEDALAEIERKRTAKENAEATAKNAVDAYDASVAKARDLHTQFYNRVSAVLGGPVQLHK